MFLVGVLAVVVELSPLVTAHEKHQTEYWIIWQRIGEENPN